jgi:hypothetical protein
VVYDIVISNNTLVHEMKIMHTIAMHTDRIQLIGRKGKLCSFVMVS